MGSLTLAHTTARLVRDIGGSVLLGPLRIIVPSVGYLLLYPLILSRSGLQVLGLWSMLATFAGVAAVIDVGYSQILRRDAGLGLGNKALRVARAHYDAAKFIFWIAGLALLVILAAGSAILNDVVRAFYPLDGFWIAIVTMLFGVALQLLTKLDDAVLSARQDATYVRLIEAVAPCVSLAAMAFGAVRDRPLEGLGVGLLSSQALTIMLFRRRLRSRHGEWSEAKHRRSTRQLLRDCSAATSRGRQFHAISVGMLLREPLFRTIVAAVVGLSAVAVWDIAMRVTKVARDVIAAGFIVLFSALATLHRAGDTKNLLRLMQTSVIVTTAAGSISLTLLLTFAPSLFPIWLGEVSPDLIEVTSTLALWNVITLVNVPFWYMLQAAGHEKYAAWSVWGHLLCLLAMTPVIILLGIGTPGIALIWTATSLVAQTQIYTQLQRREKLLFPVLTKRVALIVVSGLTLLSAAYAIALHGAALESRLSVSALQWSLLGGSLLYAASTGLALRPEIAFLRSKVRLSRDAGPPGSGLPLGVGSNQN